MAKLSSTIIYGNLDVTGNITINGQVITDGDGNVGSSSRLDNLESANLTMANNIVNLQNSFNTLQNNFNGYQGPLESPVTSTHIQWRKAGTTTWTNLIALSAITPSISALEKQMEAFKSDIINQVSILETNVINSMAEGITNVEIDNIINNALK